MDINNNVGLTNFGNTCFMNASIQMIMSASTLNMYMMDNKDLDVSSNMKYIQTFKDYYAPTTNTLGPKILYVKYMQLNTRYRGFTQEDAHEFLTYTLDDLLDNVKQLENKVHIKNIERFMTISLLQHVHYKKGQDKDSDKHITENMLSFPMDDNVKTLQDCYNLFKTEDNDDFTLTLNIETFPKYLFIGLKRFIFDGTHFKKNITNIDIPMTTLDFHPDHKYKLKSFIIHSGGYMGGHYYTYSLRKVNNDYKWFLYNDSRVSEVSLERVTSELKSAYILLYSHKNN